MRWQRLFADLEAELDGERRLDLEERIGTDTRARRTEITLFDRLRVARGRKIQIRVRGAGAMSGVLVDIGRDWLLLVEDTGGELLIPHLAVMSVSGVGRAAVVPGPGAKLHAFMDFRYAVRMISQDRSHVRATVGDGAMLDGVIDGVGADFMEIVDRVPGEGRTARERLATMVYLQDLSLLRRV